MEAVARARMAQNFRVQELGEPMLAVAELAAKAIALDPRDPLAWWASGRVHSVMGAHEEAIKHTERAISLNPNYAMAWFGLANALGRFDPTEYALSAVDKAIALSPFDPFFPVFLHVRGILLYKLRRFEDAIKDLEQAIHLGGVAVWCHLARVLAYWDLGKKDSARSAVVELLHQYPNFTIAVAIQAGLPFATQKDDFLAILQDLGIPKK
jgi:tetratricopeptide (TPR) repeat protein